MTNKTKLELRWIGKDESPRLEPRILLEDSELSYHAAHRISDKDIFDNRLIFGDNLLALKALEKEFTGAVDCVYIDPPFNTKQAFEHYDDGIEHSLWLSLMRDRLELLKRLLAPTGSIFIHIDDNELGYLIALADEVFDRKNRISVVTFKQSSVSGPKTVNPGLVTISNFVLWYAKDRANWVPNRVFVHTKRDARYGSFILNLEEHFSTWKFDTLRSAFAAAVGVVPRALKRHFGDRIEAEIEAFVLANASRVVQLARVSPEDVNSDARVELARSLEEPNIVRSASREGKEPYFFLNGKQLLFYASKVQEIDGVSITAQPASTIWDDLLSNNIHKEGGVRFPDGKKPELLLRRILELSTKPGDLVLDSFAGSGTTGAVAHKLGRRWIMVELGAHCHTHVIPRLRAVIDGTDLSGISQSVGWRGGGGFRLFRLAPSLLERDNYGNWVVSKQYNAEMLSEALSKHEGFTYSPSDAVYWQHGRSTERDFIFVTTRTLGREELAQLSEDVGSDRSLLVCCAAFRANPDEFPNLTIKKIPQAVLNRCEWGRDDYSLVVAQLPAAPDDTDSTEGGDRQSDIAPKKRNRQQAVSELELFERVD